MTLKPGVTLQAVAEQCDRIAEKLIQAVKLLSKLSRRTDELEQRNAYLESEVSRLNDRLIRLEAEMQDLRRF